MKLSIERHAGAQNTLNPSRSHVQIVQSMTVADPLTISFTLKTSWPGFPYLLADEPGMLVSPKALAALGDPAEAGYKERLAAFSLNPVGAGAGPFELESFRPKEALVMKKNPDYWGGEVFLDEVRFIVLAGAEATLEGLKADSIQVGLIRNPEERLHRVIGETIRTLRKSRDLTLKQMSRRTGLSVSLLSQIERAESSASISSLYKISAALDSRLTDLFGEF